MNLLYTHLGFIVTTLVIWFTIGYVVGLAIVYASSHSPLKRASELELSTLRQYATKYSKKYRKYIWYNYCVLATSLVLLNAATYAVAKIEITGIKELIFNLGGIFILFGFYFAIVVAKRIAISGLDRRLFKLRNNQLLSDEDLEQLKEKDNKPKIFKVTKDKNGFKLDFMGNIVTDEFNYHVRFTPLTDDLPLYGEPTFEFLVSSQSPLDGLLEDDAWFAANIVSCLYFIPPESVGEVLYWKVDPIIGNDDFQHYSIPSESH